MKAPWLVLAVVATVVFAGEPEAPLRIECACPISLRGGSAFSSKSTGGQVRKFLKAGVQYIVVDGSSAGLTVNVPRRHRVVSVRSVGGEIDVRNLGATLEVEAIGGGVFLDAIAGNARARTDGGQIRVGTVRGSLSALSGGNGISVGQVDGEAWCETAGGEIIVDRAGGPLHLATGGGNIYVGDAATNVGARSDGGRIEVLRSGGVVSAETRGGSIQIGAAKGVRCESAAGAIRIRNVAGAMRAQTAVGSILAEYLAGAGFEESSLMTGAGDITVMLPSNLSVSIQAVIESRGRLARMVSEFPEIRVIGTQMWPLRSIAAEGSLNGGGQVLRINAAGGTVYLRRQK